MHTAVIFTHPPDYPSTAIAAEALRRLGARVWLAIDAKDPAPPLAGTGLVRTHFQRRGNLNGMEAAIGVLDTLSLCAAHDGAARVLKIDSDTLLMDLAWTDVPEAVTGTGHDPTGQTLYGAAYCIRPAELPALRAEVIRRGVEETSAEDLMIGRAALALGILRRYRLHADPVFAPHRPQISPARHAASFSAVCVQRTGKHPGARAEVAATMRRLLAARWPRGF
jgi:hypothetical protein